MDLNKVQLIGRLTRDPESRTTPQGVSVCNFSIATSRVWKDQQGVQQDRTEFHNIVAWRRLGEICGQYLSKGRQIYLEGHLETRNWEDKDSGQKRYRTEIIADNMIMLGNKSDNAPANKSAAAPREQEQEPAKEPAMVQAQPTSDEEIRIEDIPF